MQTVAQLTGNALKSMQQSTTGRTQAGQPILSQETKLGVSEREQLTFVISQVFAIIKRFYPRTWGQGWSSEAEVRESQRMMWKLLSKSDSVPNANGLERLQELMINRGGDWPPSIPDIVKCLRPVPEDFGFMDSEAAWDLAKRVPVKRLPEEIRVAVADLRWDMDQAKADEVERRFKPRFVAAYEGAVNRVRAGEQLYAVAQIEHAKPVEPVLSPEEREERKKARVSQLKAMLARGAA